MRQMSDFFLKTRPGLFNGGVFVAFTQLNDILEIQQLSKEIFIRLENLKTLVLEQFARTVS